MLMYTTTNNNCRKFEYYLMNNNVHLLLVLDVPVNFEIFCKKNTFILEKC